MTINAIIETITNSPATALTDDKAYAALYAHIKAEVEAFVPDLSTEASRKEIASLAYKVTRTKTAIDAAGKKLNEDARAQINAVDAQRRKIRDDLDALAAQARKPLTEWEEMEERRLNAAAEVFAQIERLGTVTVNDTSDLVAHRITMLQEIELPEAVFAASLADARADLAKAIDGLTEAHARLLKSEADANELKRLREEAAVRQAEDQAARERAEAEKREAERKAQAAAEAKQREDAAAEAARAEERRRADEAIATAQAEAQAAIDEAARKDQERAAAETAQKAEDERRAADKKHRAKVMKAATDAIKSLGVDPEIAEKIVLAIGAGNVPNVSLKF